MTTLAHAHQQLEQDWRRRLRRNPPWARWAKHDHRLDVDEAQLRHTLAQRNPDARDTFRSLVRLAVAGDRAAATLLELVMLPKMVGVERRRGTTVNAERYAGGYSSLAGTLWEAIVTTRNIEQRWLREDIERRAWRLLYKGHTPSRERDRVELDADSRGTVDAIRGGTRTHRLVELARSGVNDDTALIDSRITWTQALERMTKTNELSPAGRQILERIMNGQQQPIRRNEPGGQAAKKQRERTFARLRSSQILLDSLAG